MAGGKEDGRVTGRMAVQKSLFDLPDLIDDVLGTSLSAFVPTKVNSLPVFPQTEGAE